MVGEAPAVSEDDVQLPALAARGVRKEYGEIIALQGLDLTIDAGELVALVGHNGSGKSTLLRLATGLLDLTDGELDVSGAPAGSLEARGAVSYVPDQPVLYDDLSVAEHLEYVARLHGLDAEPEATRELLAYLGLAHRAGDLPSQFSRGLRQRTSLALAFVRPFELLLVDEPFVGLDPLGQDACIDLLCETAAAGRTVIVATHQLSFLERVGRVVVLRDGALVRDGPPERDEILQFLG
jgi:ABC-type multidrug transport system ATPase subunit